MSTTTTRHRRAFLLLAAIPLALLAACGGNSPDVGKDSPAASSGVTADGPEDLVPSKPPTKADGVVHIQGTVGLGVEAGCLTLTNAGGTYTLIGSKVSTALVGQTVVVTGTVGSVTATTCQQGTPLQVTDVLTR